MIAYQKENNVKAAAVIGGGLLGLEAAKAMYDLGMETHIIEYAPILMCRQVRAVGAVSAVTDHVERKKILRRMGTICIIYFSHVDYLTTYIFDVLLSNVMVCCV